MSTILEERRSEEGRGLEKREGGRKKKERMEGSCHSVGDLGQRERVTALTFLFHLFFFFFKKLLFPLIFFCIVVKYTSN